MNAEPRIGDSIRAWARFPVPVAALAVLAVVVDLQMTAVLALGDPLYGELIFALAGASLAALIADLWSDSRGLGFGARLSISVSAALAIAALQFFHGRLHDQDLVAIGALLLAAMVAPYARRNVNLASFWRFNLKLGTAAAMGVVAIVVVCGGLSLLLASISYLFDLTYPGVPYAHVWATGACLVGPLFAFAMIPADFDDPFIAGVAPDLLERAVAAVLSFALAPLVLVYAAMLHVYAVKIAIATAMPKGEVGRLVLSFGIAGTATYMIACPWREVGGRIVRWLIVSWFWVMIVPTVLLLLAVSQRIAQYGVTPERYCLCLFALWLASMVVYLGASRGRMDLRVIPASLALALLLSSFGPWGAAAISANSQIRELRGYLHQKQLLSDNRLKLEPPRLATLDRFISSDPRLRSILVELDQLDALRRIAPLFASVEDNPFTSAHSPRELAKALTLYPEYQYKPPQPVEQDANSIVLKSARGRYDRMLGPIWLGATGIVVGNPQSAEHRQTQIADVQIVRSGNILSVINPGGAATFDLGPIITQPKQRAHPLLLPTEGGEAAAMVVVAPSPGEKIQAWVLLGSRDPASK